MDIAEVSLIHHVAIVLFMLWLLSYIQCCHPVAYFVSLAYLYLVHRRYIVRLQKKLQFEERKQAYQKRVLSDSETVRWLNHVVGKMWPMCMEQIASQKILLPIIPWFLEKYKPWTAKKAMVQHLYLGRNPPMFTEMRVLQQSNDDDHLVLELGLNFLTADDMSAIFAAKLRKRFGFGMWAKMHITGMHVEGKVLIGVKFLPKWPFVGRLRVCFAEPPYFQMTVKPIFAHGLDVTEVPGIAGWLDKLLSIAFEQTLVEPNMLVVDMEKFASTDQGSWFSVDEKEPIAYVRVEVLEAADMKPSDLNGLADPYVKGQLGPYRFRTKIQKKTLSPQWQEEFKIPIVTWESPNILIFQVRDKDHFVDDILGNCSVNISDFRDGQRHDMWLPLQNIKTGRLRLAATILGDSVKTQVDNQPRDLESLCTEDKRNSFGSETAAKDSFSSVSSEKSLKMADDFEPIHVEGHKEAGVWVQRPGSEVSQTWEPRKGRSRRLDTKIHAEPNSTSGKYNSVSTGSRNNDTSSTDKNLDEKHSINTVRRSLRKISSVFRRNSKEDNFCNFNEDVPSLHDNIKAANEKEIGIRFVAEEEDPLPSSGEISKEGALSSGGSSTDTPSKANMKNKAKSLFKHAEKSVQRLSHALSGKGSRNSRNSHSSIKDKEITTVSDSSDDESLPSLQGAPVVSEVINPLPGNDGMTEISNDEGTMVKDSPESSEKLPEKLSSFESKGDVQLLKAEATER